MQAKDKLDEFIVGPTYKPCAQTFSLGPWDPWFHSVCHPVTLSWPSEASAGDVGHLHMYATVHPSWLQYWSYSQCTCPSWRCPCPVVWIIMSYMILCNFLFLKGWRLTVEEEFVGGGEILASTFAFLPLNHSFWISHMT